MVEHGTNTKDKIIKASKELFYNLGYKNTRFDMISEKVGKPKSLINYHFSKKQDILIEIMEDFLVKVYHFVLESLDCDYLTKFFVFNKVYYHAFNIDEKTIMFSKEVLQRTDRSINTYKNYDVLYQDLIKHTKLNITHSQLLLKEIATFGSNRELILNYYNGLVDKKLEQVIELININTCKIFGIPNIIGNEANSKSRDLFGSLDLTSIRVFD